MSDTLFAYGTLQPHLAPPHLAARLKAMTFLSEATAAGALYDLGEYPGAIFTGHGNGRIFGSVFDVAPSLWDELDRFEGVADGLYHRRLIEVTTTSGNVLICNVYQYNLPVSESARIADGRYRRP